MAASALGPAMLAIGFIFQTDWATSTWPFETSRLSNLFLGSFAMVLVAAGQALVVGADDVMPWAVSDESGVMFGLIFLGAASSYVFGAVRPMWGYAYAPLLGFLVYDLVLLPPLIYHFSDVAPENETSLILYVAVLSYSAALATYYLLISQSTRLWSNTPS
jgi:hypothetical protein